MVSVTKAWSIERCYFWPQIQLTEMFGRLFLLLTAGRQNGTNRKKTRAVWRQREFLTSREKLEDKGGPLMYSDNPPPPCFFSKKCQAGA